MRRSRGRSATGPSAVPGGRRPPRRAGEAAGAPVPPIAVAVSGPPGGARGRRVRGPVAARAARPAGHRAADQIEADTAHARRHEPVEFLPRCPGTDDSHPAEASRRLAKGVQQVGVVRPEEAGLHQDLPEEWAWRSMFWFGALPAVLQPGRSRFALRRVVSDSDTGHRAGFLLRLRPDRRGGLPHAGRLPQRPARHGRHASACSRAARKASPSSLSPQPDTARRLGTHALFADGETYESENPLSIPRSHPYLWTRFPHAGSPADSGRCP